MRLTNEMEERARALNCDCNDDVSCRMNRELIGEIDSLKKTLNDAFGEVSQLREDSDYWNERCKTLTSEIQELRIDLSLAQSDLSIKHKYKADVLDRQVQKMFEEIVLLRKERDELKTELLIAAKQLIGIA